MSAWPRSARVAIAISIASSIVAVAVRASADPPRLPRVLHAPTAWLLPRGATWASAGVDHRGGTSIAAAYGLGGLAQLELAVDDRVVRCDPCVADRALAPTRVPTAAFVMGAGQGAWFDGQPAIALGLRATIAPGTTASSSTSAPRLAEAWAIASASTHGVRVHLGASAWAARDGGRVLRARPSSVRPLAGLEWTPAIYPRTTLLADLSWTPELGADAIRVRWLGGWGVRYQALGWASIELAVRHREADDLAGSTVMVRVNGRR